MRVTTKRNPNISSYMNMHKLLNTKTNTNSNKKRVTTNIRTNISSYVNMYTNRNQICILPLPIHSIDSVGNTSSGFTKIFRFFPSTKENIWKTLEMHAVQIFFPSSHYNSPLAFIHPDSQVETPFNMPFELAC